MDLKERMEHMKRNPALLQSLMESQDGQRLLQLLQGSSSSNQLNQAAQQAADGNAAQMLQMLRHIMASPEGSDLVQRISQQFMK